MQSCTLTAVAALPVLFNASSLRSFEADKAVLLCLLALTVLVAWAFSGAGRIELQERTRSTGPLRGLLAMPLIFTAVLLLVSHVLATVWSIHPLTSLVGSYHRYQGLGVTAAHFILFLVLAVGVRDRKQIENVVTGMLLASLAVGLYGIFQHLGVDPIVWHSEGRSPARSTLGALGFVAGFLCISAPLALYRLVLAVRAVGASGPLHVAPLTLLLLITFVLLGVGFASGFGNTLLACALSFGFWWSAGRSRHGTPTRFLEVWVYSFILSVQLTSIILTQSRAGFLALLLCTFFFAWLWSVATRRRRTSLALVGGLSALTVALVLTALSNRGPETDSASRRAGQATPRVLAVSGDLGSARVRLLIWQSAVELVRANPIRALAGHGPDTQRLALYPHYDPELARLEHSGAVADRAHNETYDVLISVGFIGLLIYVAFWIQLLLIGHRQIGAVGSGEWRRFAWYCIAGIGIFVGPAVLVSGWAPFAGTVLPIGLLAGAGIYVLRHAVLRPARCTQQDQSTAAGRDALLGVALLTGATAYLLSTSVDVNSVANTAYFWVLAGLLAAMAAIRRAERMAHQPTRASPDVPGSSADRAVPLVTAVIVLTLLHAFGFATGGFLADIRILWLPLLIFVAAGAVAGRVWACTIWAVAGVALYLLIHELAAHGSYHPASIAYVGSLGTLLLWSARAFRAARPLGLRAASTVPVGCILVAGGAYLGLTAVEADVRARAGHVAELEHRFADAAQLYAAASALAPYEARYQAMHAAVLLAQAQATQTSVPTSRRESLLASAEALLTQAMKQNPWDPDHPANLARLHMVAASALAPGNPARRERLQDALRLYRHVLLLDPNNPSLWIESAWAYGLSGSAEEALRGYRRAVQLDPTRCEVAELSSWLDPERAATVHQALSASCRPVPSSAADSGALP